jgi:hypothetical protein
LRSQKIKTISKKTGNFLLWVVYDFSGVRFIWSKILPPKETENTKRQPSTFIFWILGIYIGLFGITSQRYENRVDIIENRANSIFAQISTSAYKKALSMITRIQRMECPIKPYILKPGTVFASLFSRSSRYDEIVDLLTRTIENCKADLKEVNLSYAQLHRADLQRDRLCLTRFQSADLREADLPKGPILWEPTSGKLISGGLYSWKLISKGLKV